MSLFNYYSSVSPAEAWNLSNLSHCTGLQTITFILHLHLFASNDFIPMFFDHFSHILSLTRKAPILKVAYRVERGVVGSLMNVMKAEDWVRVVNALIELPCLKVVSFMVQGRHEVRPANGFENPKWISFPAESQTVLNEHLTLLRTKGIEICY